MFNFQLLENNWKKLIFLFNYIKIVIFNNINKKHK